MKPSARPARFPSGERRSRGSGGDRRRDRRERHRSARCSRVFHAVVSRPTLASAGASASHPRARVRVARDGWGRRAVRRKRPSGRRKQRRRKQPRRTSSSARAPEAVGEGAASGARPSERAELAARRTTRSPRGIDDTGGEHARNRSRVAVGLSRGVEKKRFDSRWSSSRTRMYVLLPRAYALENCLLLLSYVGRSRSRTRTAVVYAVNARTRRWSGSRSRRGSRSRCSRCEGAAVRGPLERGAEGGDGLLAHRGELGVELVHDGLGLEIPDLHADWVAAHSQ